MNLSQLHSLVKVEANKKSEHILVRLVDRLHQRESLNGCIKHDALLIPYIESQIYLTKVKRAYYNGFSFQLKGYNFPTEVLKSHYLETLNNRNECRLKYRSKDCTCWTKRK